MKSQRKLDGVALLIPLVSLIPLVAGRPRANFNGLKNQSLCPARPISIGRKHLYQVLERRKIYIYFFYPSVPTDLEKTNSMNSAEFNLKKIYFPPNLSIFLPN